MNKAIIVGNLGRDPEMRYSQAGKAICRLSVATQEGSGDRKETEWHDVVVFDKQAEACSRYISSGSKVAVEGRIRTRSWEDANTGAKRYRTEIIASRVEFLSSARESRSETRTQARSEPMADGFDDDIPF